MSSQYKFKWMETKTVGGVECPSFQLTSRTGMVWEGYFSNNDNAVKIEDDPLNKGGGMMHIDFIFTKGDKTPLPRKAYALLNYKIMRAAINAIRKYARMEIENVKKELGVE